MNAIVLYNQTEYIVYELTDLHNGLGFHYHYKCYTPLNTDSDEHEEKLFGEGYLDDNVEIMNIL